MGKHRRREGASILLTEFTEMKVRGGLLYVWCRSGEEKLLLIVPPPTAVSAVQMAMQALKDDNVLPAAVSAH